MKDRVRVPLIVYFKFLATIFLVFMIHEFGHILFQLIFNIPISFGVNLIGLSTTYELNLLEIAFPQNLIIAFAGFFATLVSFPLLKNWFISQKELNILLGFNKKPYKSFAVLRFALYFIICIAMSQSDFLLVKNIIVRLIVGY